MTIYNRRKKIILFASITLLVLIGVGLITNAVLATETSSTGNSIAEFAIDAVALPYVWGLAGILFVLQRVLAQLIAFAGFILNQALAANITVVPSTLKVVLIGWGAMRDIANALFILIILWIAFTIIFNIENLGGRKLLIRVITVALLINFSLAMVTAVFGLTNAIAKAFADKIETDDVAGFILNTTKLQTVVKQINKEGLEGLSKTYKNETTPNATTQTNPETKTNYEWGLKDTLLSSIGIQPAHAFPVIGQVGIGGAVGCGIGIALSWIPALGPIGATTLCAGSAIAGAIIDFFAGWTVTVADAGYDVATRLALATLFLFLMTVSFIMTSIALILRLVAMIFTSILAPAAMLAYIIPGGYTEKYWKMWVEYLFRWAFFAPAFYFLLYLTLYLLQNFDAVKGKQNTSVLYDADRVLQLLVILVFMIVSIKLARDFGGATANMVYNFGSKLGSKALGWTKGVAKGIIPLKSMRRIAAPAAEQLATSEGRIPAILRRVPGVQRGAARLAAGEREAAAAAEKQYQRYTADELGRMLSGEFRPTHRAAIMKQLEGKKGLDKLSDSQVESEVKRLKNIGEDVKPFLKQKPGIALRNPDIVLSPAEISAAVAAGISPRQMALKKITDTMNSDELAKLDKSIYGDKDAIRAIWQSVDTDDLGKIGIKNKDLSQNMKDFVESMGGPDLKTFKASLTPTQLDKFNKYFDGSFATGTGMGWKPKNWIPTVDKKKLANGAVGVPYAEYMDILDGTLPYSVDYLNTPTWLTATDNTATGGRTISLSGTPPAQGRFDFSFEVTDATGGKALRSYRINVG